jgi:hypothetical protein
MQRLLAQLDPVLVLWLELLAFVVGMGVAARYLF